MKNMEDVVPEIMPERIPGIKHRLSVNKTDKKGRAIVHLVVYLNRQVVMFNTGVKVDPDYWNAKSNTIKKSHEQHSNYNLIISNAYSRLTEVLVRFKLQNREVTPKALKDEYSRPSMNYDFLAFMDIEINKRRAEITPKTFRLHHATYLKFKAWRSPIAFAELTEELFQEFNRYLKNTLKNEANTRHNTIKIIRTYINIARRKKIMSHYPLERMPVKRTIPDRVFLDDDELKILVDRYNKGNLSDKHQKVLREFIFACYTGFRISDVRALEMDNLIGNLIVLVPEKSKNTHGRTVKVPIVPIAQRMMNDASPYRVKGLVFSCYSEQKMREYLKEVVKIVKIRKNVNFHSARHTFATRFLRKTKNMAALQKLLGHSKIEQTMVYAHVVTEDLVDEMRVFESD